MDPQSQDAAEPDSEKDQSRTPPVEAKVSVQDPRQFWIHTAATLLMGAATVICSLLVVSWQINSSVRSLDRQLSASAQTYEKQLANSGLAVEKQIEAASKALDRQIRASSEALDKQANLQQKQWEIQHAASIFQESRKEKLRVLKDLREAQFDFIATGESANHELVLDNCMSAVRIAAAAATSNLSFLSDSSPARKGFELAAKKVAATGRLASIAGNVTAYYSTATKQSEDVIRLLSLAGDYYPLLTDEMVKQLTEVGKLLTKGDPAQIPRGIKILIDFANVKEREMRKELRPLVTALEDLIRAMENELSNDQRVAH